MLTINMFLLICMYLENPNLFSSKGPIPIMYVFTQQQKMALTRNNSALQNVTLRTKSESLSYIHIFTLLPRPQQFLLIPFRLLWSSSVFTCYSHLLKIFYSLLSNFPSSSCCSIFLLNPLFSPLFNIPFPWHHSLCFSFSSTCHLIFKLHSSRNARASKFSHLPFRQLPTDPHGIPPWSLRPVPVQECLHQQHCGVSLTFIGQIQYNS